MEKIAPSLVLESMTAPVELSPPNGPMLVADGPERKVNSESPGKDPLAGRDLDTLITDPVCQRLFRLFLVFAGDNLVRCPDGRLLRCVSRAQARFLLSQIGQLRGQMQICPDRPLPSVHSEEDAQFLSSGQSFFPDEQMGQSQLSSVAFSDQVTFREMLGHALALCPHRLQFSPLVDRLFARYVLQIVRKGFLLCRPIRPLPRALRPFSCCLLPPTDARSSPAQQLGFLHSRGPFRYRPSAGPWRPFWCVLMPGQLQLWPLGTPKSGKGGQRLPLDAELESADTGGRCWTLKLHKDSQLELSDLDGQLFGWLLATRSSLVELAHFDQLQRQLWIADLEMVVRKRRPSILLQFDRINSRRPVSQLAERRSPSVGKQQLQKENRALVELLEAERRALKDEETVRQLATRMLDEEVQRGDSLRQTVECLANQLETEREQRQLLEHSIIEQQEHQQQQQQQQQRPEQPILNEISPTGEQNGKLADNIDEEDLCLDIPVLVPFDRLITPQPRSRKGGKRLRDSIRNKKEKARKESGQELPVEEKRESREMPMPEERGEELKVVDVGPRPPPKPGPKPKRKMEKEQKKPDEQQGNEELADNGELFAGIYDQATLRATDYWDATKPAPQPPNGICPAADANFLMAMSTRSV